MTRSISAPEPEQSGSAHAPGRLAGDTGPSLLGDGDTDDDTDCGSCEDEAGRGRDSNSTVQLGAKIVSEPAPASGRDSHALEVERFVAYVNNNRLQYLSAPHQQSPASRRSVVPLPGADPSGSSKFSASARTVRSQSLLHDISPRHEDSSRTHERSFLSAQPSPATSDDEDEDYDCESLRQLLFDDDSSEFSQRWNELLADVDGGPDVFAQGPDGLGGQDELSPLSSGSPASANPDQSSAPSKVGAPNPPIGSPRRNGSLRTSADDFEPLRIVGTGGSGQVYLVRHLVTRKRFAMKVLNKAEIIHAKRIERVKTEREILTRASESPFLTQLNFAFHSHDMLFFVMEFCSGGNLHECVIREHEIRNATMSREDYKTAMDAAAEGLGLLGSLTYIDYFSNPSVVVASARRGRRLRAPMSVSSVLRRFALHESQVQFLVAEIIEGLSFLHNMGFVYRDIKPQNVMLHVDGHIRLGDFGISKKGERCAARGTVQLRSNSFVGTLEYMAPEVVAGEPQECALDHWSLGVLTYELLFGLPPFLPARGDSDNRLLFAKILQPDKSLQFPPAPACSEDAMSFIRNLLRRDVRSRMSLSQARAHPWLAGTNWSTLANSSGFHKLSPRIHLHREAAARRPAELVLPSHGAFSNSANIFLSAGPNSAESAARDPATLRVRLQKSMSSSRLLPVSSRGQLGRRHSMAASAFGAEDDSPELQAQSTAAPAPAAQSPSPAARDVDAGRTTHIVDPASPKRVQSAISSSTPRKWWKRLRRFMPRLRLSRNAEGGSRSPAHIQSVPYVGLTHSVDAALRCGSFHSGRTISDSSSPPAMADACAESCLEGSGDLVRVERDDSHHEAPFVGFDWKCDVP